MKDAFLKFLLLLFVSVFLFLSCEKQADYRNKYLGNWIFDITYTHEVYSLNQGFHDTTEFSSQRGIIVYGSGDKIIRFESQGYTNEFTIDKTGKVIPTPGLGYNYSESGGFEGENVFKYYFHHQSGGTPNKFQTTGIYGAREM